MRVTRWAVHAAVHNAAWCRDPSALLHKPPASELTGGGLSWAAALRLLLLFLGSVLYSIAPLQPVWSYLRDLYQHRIAACSGGLGWAYTSQGGLQAQTYLPATSRKPQSSTTSCKPAGLFRSVAEYHNFKPNLTLLMFKSWPFWSGPAKTSRGSVSVTPLPLAFCFYAFFFFF